MGSGSGTPAATYDGAPVRAVRGARQWTAVPPPVDPKIYHIVHVDRLASIVSDGCLWSDAMMAKRPQVGTGIGMTTIKQNRRSRGLRSHPGLMVGDCVPFYFCPRSVMLYVIYKGNNPGLTYHGGQEPILHLEADFREAIDWADANGRRWAFTDSNAANLYFGDYADLAQLDQIKWEEVETRDFQGKDGKWSEFLFERSFPWSLVRRIAVHSGSVHRAVCDALRTVSHRPQVEVRGDWYY